MDLGGSDSLELLQCVSKKNFVNKILSAHLVHGLVHVHLNVRVIQETPARGPLRWVFVKQGCDQPGQATAVPHLVNLLVATIDDPEYERIQRIRRESMLQCTQLIQYTTQRPHVGLGCVRIGAAHLWGPTHE